MVLIGLNLPREMEGDLVKCRKGPDTINADMNETGLRNDYDLNTQSQL